MSSNNSSVNELTNHQSTAKMANTTGHNLIERNLPEHLHANQPQTEAERQQQLQDAHLENQDARVRLGDQKPQGSSTTDAGIHQPEHKEIGSMNPQNR